MEIKKIYLGYWYQRTTLHLSEVYDFVKEGYSPLDLDTRALNKHHAALGVTDIAMQIGYFEYLEMVTKLGVRVRMYEDGLVVFDKNFSHNISRDLEVLNKYFENQFSPAMSYLFSLGAPVPKELAQIKSVSPFFIVVQKATPKSIKSLFSKLGQDQYYNIDSSSIKLYRGGNVFIVDAGKIKEEVLDELILMQIFFREFKVQLHRYLNMHRSVWERIAAVKERGMIKGKDVGQLRNHLEEYKKTIELIDGRIEQMGVHIGSREEIISSLELDRYLNDVLQFKYSTLDETRNYIQSLWKMTKNYVDSAIKVFEGIQSASTKDSVKALTLITTIGVLSGVIGYLRTDEWPKLNAVGIAYFGLLLIGTYLANKLVNKYYKNRKYKIKDIKLSKDL